MSNICSFSMENTHHNVEFGVLQKTSKQSLISIFFNCLHKLEPPTHNFLDPPLNYLPSRVLGAMGDKNDCATLHAILLGIGKNHVIQP